MKFKRNLLLVSLIALGTISFASAQETNKMQQKKMERVHHKKSSTQIKEGVITLSTMDADGTSKTEKVDLTGKSIEEAISILRQKRGEGYGNYKGKNMRRHKQGTRNKSNKFQKNKLQQNKK